MTETLVLIAILHWVGDFVLQTRWMADNKSKDMRALGIHVFAYFVVLWFGVHYHRHEELDIFLYAAVNSGFHLATDFVTSRLSSHYYRQNRIHAFFVVVGLDQMIHGITLLLTLPLLM